MRDNVIIVCNYTARASLSQMRGTSSVILSTVLVYLPSNGVVKITKLVKKNTLKAGEITSFFSLKK